jgi:effector-binding domain-containing protein
MPSKPKLERRDEQPYVGIRTRMTMGELAGGAGDSLFPEVFAWLGARGLAPQGAPFIRYLVIDMDAALEMDWGVPVGEAPPDQQGDDRVRPGVLPAGRYATAIHTGPYGGDGLIHANAALQDWAKEQGVAFQVRQGEHGEVWGSRLERYLSNPAEEPDPEAWRTEIAYLVAEEPATG